MKFTVDEIEVFFYEKAEMLQVEWITSPKNDLVADSLSLLILQINEKPTPQLLSMMETVAEERQYDDFIKKLMIILAGHFEAAELHRDGEGRQRIEVAHRECRAVVDARTREVALVSGEAPEFVATINELI